MKSNWIIKMNDGEINEFGMYDENDNYIKTKYLDDSISVAKTGNNIVGHEVIISKNVWTYKRNRDVKDLGNVLEPTFDIFLDLKKRMIFDPTFEKCLPNWTKEIKAIIAGVNEFLSA